TEPADDLPEVLINEGQFRQVFLGVASNGLEAMEGRGRLVIRTRAIRDEVEVEFEDEGPGVPEEILGRIFDPFFTTKPPGQGTGLGLAIAQGIVADHGGRIEVQSRPGKGSVFRVVVPALARLRERAYDVVILDMKMPRKEGIEVLRELGAFPEHPQVIVMTGFQEVATAVEAMKLGAYDYLTKPTKIEELDVLVRKAAEKGQLLRDNQALRAHAPGAAPFSGILTKSARMHEVLRVVDRGAPTDSSVLVLGESGTGKELVARAIHERSARAERPFVPIHCGALPRERSEERR